MNFAKLKKALKNGNHPIYEYDGKNNEWYVSNGHFCAVIPENLRSKAAKEINTIKGDRREMEKLIDCMEEARRFEHQAEKTDFEYTVNLPRQTTQRQRFIICDNGNLAVINSIYGDIMDITKYNCTENIRNGFYTKDLDDTEIFILPIISDAKEKITHLVSQL